MKWWISPRTQGHTLRTHLKVGCEFPMIRILIADDSTAMRDGLSDLLGRMMDFKGVGIACDGIEAVEKAQGLLPDVIIMDCQMPNMDGVEATTRIKETLPGIGILFLSVFADRLKEAILAGADGYLMKDCEPEELYAELRCIAAIYQPDK